jgi:tellurite resistance protein TehA-like permease
MDKDEENIIGFGFLLTFIPTLFFVLNNNSELNLPFIIGCFSYLFGVVIMALPTFGNSKQVKKDVV